MLRGPIQAAAVRELMRRANILLVGPGCWVQGRQAQTAECEDTTPESASAVQWCCLGALRHEAVGMCGGRFEGAASELYDAATVRMAEAIVDHLGCRRVSRHAATALAAWQDACERTRDEVSDLFAIAA